MDKPVLTLDSVGSAEARLERRQRAMREALLDAVAAIPEPHTVKHLSRLVYVSRQRLYDCVRAGEFSPELAKRIEEVTGGAVLRERLNPRIFG